MTTSQSLAIHQDAIRSHLLEFLRGGSAHTDVRTAIANISHAHYGTRPENAPHSPWELIEHMRFTVHDLLEFCTNPQYVAPEWPEDYWPASEKPGDANAWSLSVEGLLTDLSGFEALVENPETDLAAKIEWGQGQTLLREVLLAIDHTSYHLGQLVLVRRQLEDWKQS